MRPLHKLHRPRRLRSLDDPLHPRRPGPCGVDERSAPALDHPAVVTVLEMTPVSGHMRRDERRGHGQLRPQRSCGVHHRCGQLHVVGLRIRVPEDSLEIAGHETVEPAPPTTRDLREPRRPAETREHGVQRQPGANLPRAPARGAVDRQNEVMQADEVRCNPQQDRPLAQALMHDRQLPLLEIPQSAVDELARPARRPGGKVGLLQEQNAVTGGRGGLGDADAVDPAADDHQIPLRRHWALPLAIAAARRARGTPSSR